MNGLFGSRQLRYVCDRVGAISCVRLTKWWGGENITPYFRHPPSAEVYAIVPSTAASGRQ
jgi:hypothetical protein